MAMPRNPLDLRPYATPVDTGSTDEGAFPTFSEHSYGSPWLPRSQGPAEYEALPGITSGAPPKPWGLDRDQIAQLLEMQRQRNALNWQAMEDQRVQQQWFNTYLGRVLPQPNYGIDPGAVLNPLNPSYRTPELNWPRWEAPPADTET